MAVAGYSGTPLLKKLGIKPEMKLFILNAPENYSELLETDISDQLYTTSQIPDLVHLFAKNMATFKAGMKEILPLYKRKTALIIWVS